MLPIGHYLFLSFALFLFGLLGAVLRRQPAIVGVSIALMVTAAGINLAAFSRFFGDSAGQHFAVLLIVVALFEGVVLSALIYRHSCHSDPDISSNPGGPQ